MFDELLGGAPSGEESPPQTMESIFEEALSEETGESQDGDGSPEESAAPSGEGKVEEAPEHLVWAAKVSGNTNEDGSLNTDKVAEQAFNLNKQNQEQAEKITAYDKIMENPAVKAVIDRVVNGNEPPAEPTKEAEKPESEMTDLEILDKRIDERVKKEVEPLKAEVRYAKADLVEREFSHTLEKLRDEFNGEDGMPKYDDISDDVNKVVQTAAAKANVSVRQLMEYLALEKTLHETLQSAASKIAMPKIKEAMASLKKKGSDQQESAAEKASAAEKGKRAAAAALLGRGSPSTQVEAAAKEITSWEEAHQAAIAEVEAQAS